MTDLDTGPAIDPEVERFDALFVAHHDALYRYAVRRVGIDAAGDVVAEVYLVAWRRRTEVPHDQARLWLFGVASRVVSNEQRSEVRRSRLGARLAQRSQAVAVPDHAEVVSDEAAAIDDAVRVRRALAALPPADQEALRLTEWEHLTAEEAAVVTQCSAATFRVRLHRARRRLAAQLAEGGPAGRTVS